MYSENKRRGLQNLMLTNKLRQRKGGGHRLSKRQLMNRWHDPCLKCRRALDNIDRCVDCEDRDRAYSHLSLFDDPEKLSQQTDMIS